MARLTRRSLLASVPTLLAAARPGVLAAERGRWAPVVRAARAHAQLHAILVAHRGETVVAEAFRGGGLAAYANVKSVSKSILSLLLGAAIDRGVVASVEARLAEVAPGLIPPDARPQVSELTLKDLVTLRAGLERTSGPNYGEWIASDDWVADALSRPFVAEPGGRMLYSTGSFHVLGAALAEASGRDLLSLTRAWLGDPLDIRVPPWTRDPQGYYMGGNQMALTPQAMLKIGELVRRRGRWQGRQVLPADWIDACLTPVTRSPYSGLGYGYGWFTTRTHVGRLALARGYGGQIIAVAPEAEITVAITSDPTQPARSGGYFGSLMQLITDEVLRAAV